MKEVKKRSELKYELTYPQRNYETIHVDQKYDTSYQLFLSPNSLQLMDSKCNKIINMILRREVIN